jgi:hypothetical protein
MITSDKKHPADVCGVGGAERSWPADNSHYCRLDTYFFGVCGGWLYYPRRIRAALRLHLYVVGLGYGWMV